MTFLLPNEALAEPLCCEYFSDTLRQMVGKGRLLVLVGLLVIILGLAFVQDTSAKSKPPSFLSFTEYQQSTGNIDVELNVSPQAVEPGDPINVIVILTNNDSAIQAPEITLQIPEVLSFGLDELPSGTLYNAQTNEISWQPIVPGAGSSQSLNISLRSNVADIKTPEQKIVAILKSGGQEQTFTTSYWVGVRPTVNLSFDPPQAAVGQPVHLVGDVSGPGPITQIWSLGDGRIIDVSNPEVVYSTPGIYNIILQASNPLGSATNSGQITIVSQPIARFSISDPAPIANEIVNFIDQSGGQSPLIYLWDFGDGITSTEKNPSHQYPSPGTYQVHLTIQNDVGTSETFLPVNVGLPPTADLIVDEFIDAGKPINGQVFFDDTTSKIHWDMGDGHVYEGGQITHVYWSAGVYQITVTASNEFGDTVLERWIDVNPGNLQLYLPLLIKGGGSSPGLEVLSSSNELEILPEGEAEIALEPLELPPEMSPAEQLLAYINEARRIHNLQPLTLVTELSNAAQIHTDDMANLGLTGHEGSDGSSPALRVQLSGYPGGYGGETTAWGMQYAIEPVQYWLSSPAHRAIILNSAATDVGVAFSENYSAPNVWYWTAEFGSLGLPRVEVSLPSEEATSPSLAAPVSEIKLLGPPQNSEFALTSGTNLIFTWSWSEPLSAEQQFSIFMEANGRTFRIGSVRGSQPSNQYQFNVPSSNVPVTPGLHHWLVRLEDNSQALVLYESLSWPIVFRESGNELSNPQPTVEPTPVEPSTELEPPTTPVPRSRSR